MSDDFRVAIAALFGAGSPVVTWFVSLGPLLDVLLTAGQISVAVVTVLYIYRKWRNARNKK
jgi:hypothetical protein